MYVILEILGTSVLGMKMRVFVPLILLWRGQLAPNPCARRPISLDNDRFHVVASSPTNNMSYDCFNAVCG